MNFPYLVIQVEPSVKRARDLYEAAVDHFGTSHPGKFLSTLANNSYMYLFLFLA